MPTATDTQVPSSIVADAFFPLSKTWYDALPSVYPEGNDLRIADAGAASDTAAIASDRKHQCEQVSLPAPRYPR